MASTVNPFPSLDELGRDLLRVSLWRKALPIVLPFAFAGGFFALAARGFWLAALACPVLVSFLTYGSTSHDLVHRTLRLPSWLNEVLLCFMELISFRSGHAYRSSHLYHHAHFPDPDDLEAGAVRMAPMQALLDGLTLQERLYFWALRKCGNHRAWVISKAT